LVGARIAGDVLGRTKKSGVKDTAVQGWQEDSQGKKKQKKKNKIFPLHKIVIQGPLPQRGKKDRSTIGQKFHSKLKTKGGQKRGKATQR